MNLTVRDVSRLLNTPEKTIYQWLKEGLLPFHKIQDEYLFNRAEILEWATSHRLSLSPAIFEEPGAEPQDAGGLAEALGIGGIHYGIAGDTREEILRKVVGLLALPEGTDRDFLGEMLLARENLGSTAVGGGIAIPHPRFPVILPPAPDTLSLCFLSAAVDFGALDGQPVRTLFVLVSSTVKGHLRWLSRLAYALQDAALRRLLSDCAERGAILAEFSRLDGALRKAP